LLPKTDEVIVLLGAAEPLALSYRVLRSLQTKIELEVLS